MILGKAISPFALRKKNGGSGGNDADAQLFITATGISGTNATATNQLVIDLKSANIWTKMKAIYPFVGGTSAFTHKFNLKDPRDLDAAYRLVFSGGGTFSANGYQPNGTNAYADTFLIPSTALTSNSNHISYYSRTNIAQASLEIGCQTDPISGLNTKALYQYLRYTGDSYALSVTNTDANRLNLTSTNSLGLFIGSRTSNVSLKAYKNNSLIGTQTATSHGTQSSVSVILGAFKRQEIVNLTFSLYSSKECAFASIGDGLTDAEALALYNAVNAFQVSLARNV